MSKLDSESIMGRLAEIQGKMSEDTADGVPQEGQMITIEKAAKIQKIITDMVEAFKAEKKFNWRVHILDPIGAIVDIAKLIDNLADRAVIEQMAVDVIKDLYKEYSPKLPWLPKFLSNWVTGLIVKSVIPSVVDWLLDKVYGPDED